MTRILDSIEDIRAEALELDEFDRPKKHIGSARNVLRLKLPISVDTARCLFAAISIDESLPKRRKKRNVDQINHIAEDENGREFGDEDLSDAGDGDTDGAGAGAAGGDAGAGAGVKRIRCFTGASQS